MSLTTAESLRSRSEKSWSKAIRGKMPIKVDYFGSRTLDSDHDSDFDDDFDFDREGAFEASSAVRRVMP